MSERVGLQVEFGWFAKPLATQLRKQRLKVDAKTVAHWQKDADAILRLAVRGLITERARNDARKRLMRQMIRHRDAAPPSGTRNTTEGDS